MNGKVNPRELGAFNKAIHVQLICVVLDHLSVKLSILVSSMIFQAKKSDWIGEEDKLASKQVEPFRVNPCTNHFSTSCGNNNKVV